MNERIRELAKQAGFQSYITTHEEDVAMFEKFAELIVRECMNVVSDEAYKVPEEWRCKDGRHIWWKIKEHFGVE